MTMEKYAEKYRRRGTMVFSFGKLLEVDATDFNNISYIEIMQKLETMLVSE